MPRSSTTRNRSMLILDRKSTRLNSSHSQISYAVFCLKKKNNITSKIKNTTNYTRTNYALKWLEIKKKHSIPLRNRLPLIIRYFTCEGKNLTIIVYEYM